MPLFVYSWPNGDFGLMSAADEGDAFEKLDEVADLGLARVCRYTGPIFFEFTQETTPFGIQERIKKEREERYGSKQSPQQKFFADCFAQGKYTDVDIRVPNSEEVIKAHRIIIAQQPYFANLLAKGDAATLQIDNEDVSASLLRSIVTWIYTGQFSLAHNDSQNRFDEYCKAALAVKSLGVSELATEMEEAAAELASGQHSLITPMSMEPMSEAENRKYKEAVQESLQWYQKMIPQAQEQGLLGLAQHLMSTVKTYLHSEASLRNAGASQEFIQQVMSFEKRDTDAVNLEKLADMISGSPHLLSTQTVALGSDSTEDGYRMWGKISSLAFPRTAAVWKDMNEKFDSTTRKAKPDDAAFLRLAKRLEKANDDDLNEMSDKAKSIEEGLAGSDDPIDRMMLNMGVTRDVFSGRGSEWISSGGPATGRTAAEEPHMQQQMMDRFLSMLSRTLGGGASGPFGPGDGEGLMNEEEFGEEDFEEEDDVEEEY